MVYQKTRAKQHKLCLGQNKKFRCWRVNNETESESSNISLTLDNGYEDQSLIFPTEYEEDTVPFIQTGPVKITSSHVSTHSILSTLPPKKRNQIPKEHSLIRILPSNNGSFEQFPQQTKPDSALAESGIKKKNKPQSCRDKFVKKLMDTKMLHNLFKKLDEKNLTTDFLYSIRAMSSGHIPVDTIPHLAFLDSVRFKCIKFSRNMTYSRKMKKFWHCFYKVGGGPPLRLLSGLKGTGDNNLETSS